MTFKLLLMTIHSIKVYLDILVHDTFSSLCCGLWRKLLAGVKT